jgi:hypothetical protein
MPKPKEKELIGERKIKLGEIIPGMKRENVSVPPDQ